MFEAEVVPITKNVPASPFLEIGRSGLKRFGGILDEQVLTVLKGQRGVRVFQEMRDTDSVVGAILSAYEQSIRGTTWFVNPPKIEDEQLALRAADFLKSCMEDLSHTFDEVISEICTMFPFGWCLPGDQTVLNGLCQPVPIRDLQIGDFVITDKGRTRPILGKSVRFHVGDVVEIQLQGHPDIVRLTPEHRLSTLDGLCVAGDLSCDQALLRPRLRLKPGGHYNLGWLLGVYLAEGHMRSDNRNTVLFSVHIDESEFLASKLDSWVAEVGPAIEPTGRHASCRAGITRDKRCLGATVRLTHSIFASVIENLIGGSSAATKHLKQLDFGVETARGIVDGWLWGDGCNLKCNKAGHDYTSVAGSTINYGLAQQMQILGGSLGFPTSLARNAGGSRSVLRGKTLIAPVHYSVSFTPACNLRSKVSEKHVEAMQLMRSMHLTYQSIGSILGLQAMTVWGHLNGKYGDGTHGSQCKVHDDFISHRIVNVSKTHYADYVYDLEVDEDHTFCAGPVAVSNSFMEVIYKIRGGFDTSDPKRKSKFSDGRIGWRKIALRKQSTLVEWIFDEFDGIQGMIQQAPPDYRFRTLPIEKSLLFRTRIEGNNPEGRSILMNAFRSWYIKKNIEEVEAIGVERDLIGLPKIKPPDNFDIKSKENAAVAVAIHRLLYALRRDEQDGVFLPPGWDITLMGGSGASRRQFDINQIINRYEKRIALSALAQAIMLGIDRVGSFALVRGQIDNFFEVSVQGYLNAIAEVFNRFETPRLFALNPEFSDLGGMLPELVPGKITAPSIRELGEFIRSVGGAGFLIGDQDVEKELRRAGGFGEPALRRAAVVSRREQQAQNQKRMQDIKKFFAIASPFEEHLAEA